MKTKKTMFLGVTFLLAVSLILPLACAEGVPTPTPAEFKTFSKYGFSFEYPKKFSVTEMGLFENEATDNSGIVQVGVANDEVELFQTTWLQMIPSTWEIGGDLGTTIEDSFAGAESSEGVASLDRGELIDTTKAGHQLLYQYFTVTSTEGDKIYGIAGAFYCDRSQKVFHLMTMNTTISAKPDVLEDFQNYLDSFVCH